MTGLLFAGFAYICFNAISAVLALFLVNLWLPYNIDSMPWPTLPLWPAIAVDLGLIALFGLQHSIMARQSFKRRLDIVPAHLQRSVYVLATCVVLALLVVCWQPLPAMLWRLDNPLFVNLLWALYGLGWLVAIASTHMINHYELLGLSQAIRHWRGTVAPPADTFRTPYLYRYVRHPLYFGLLLAFWSTPQMSLGHMLFATGMTAYILIGIAYEERDLIALFGQRYRDYRAAVPALIPGLKSKA